MGKNEQRRVKNVFKAAKRSKNWIQVKKWRGKNGQKAAKMGKNWQVVSTVCLKWQKLGEVGKKRNKG